MLFYAVLAVLFQSKTTYFCQCMIVLLHIDTPYILYEIALESMKRIAIYPKDIMIITGRGERYSRELLRSIRNQLKKEKHQIVSFDEFCCFMGIKTDEVERKIKS